MSFQQNDPKVQQKQAEENDHKVKQARNIFSINLGRDEKINVSKQLIGLLMFIVVFVMIIPVIIYKHGHYEFLAAYLPNLDLVGTVVSYHGGPTVGKYLSELYPATPTTTYGFLSQSFINWMALMGLTFLVAQETVKTRNFYKGWSIGFCMIACTYLLPGQFISGSMDKAFDWLHNNVLPDKKSHLLWGGAMLVGIMASFLVIKIEEKLIHFLRGNGALENFAKMIVAFPKQF